MILTPHILVGAAIVSQIPNIWGLILAFFSHFVLDVIPHFEYSIKGIKRFEKRQFFRSLIKVELDFCLGVIIFAFIVTDLSSTRVIYGLLGIAAAVLPDGLMFFYYVSGGKWIKRFAKFHHAVHIKRDKKKRKLSFFTVFTQVLVAAIAILILLF